MDISFITEVTGVLGFTLSVFVLILTRWERRTKIVIEMFRGDEDRIDPNFTEGESELGEVIGIRVINTGNKSIVIDRSSFCIKGNNKTITIYNTDWVGLNLIPAPLNPYCSFEIGVFCEIFETILGVEEFEKFMNVEDYDKCLITVTATFRNDKGNIYSSGHKYRYSFYVSEFYPAQNIGS